MKKRIVILLAACFGVSIVNAQLLPYQDATLSAGQRADYLLSRLTLDEKVSLMMNNSPAIERLGVPEFNWWNEALHGIGRNGVATVFPITMAMAASWDDVLLHKVFTAVSDEARVKAQQAKRSGEIKRYQSLSFWTPNINIFRDPRWGRGQETYGEDPYLTSRMGLAVVRGLQGVGYNGEDLGISPYRKLLACAKHFAVHSGPEWNRHTFNIEELPERDLWETYLPAFKALVVQGKVAEVMCAYQRVYGEACCAHTRYEQQILRKEWGFDGLVTSDCGAIRDFLPERHNVARDGAEASAKAVLTGTDVECGSTYKNLPEAVRRGDISESALDTSLRRLLVARFELGDFDNDSLVAWTKIPEDVVACKEHKQLALDMARKSIVLLKNDDILPLRKGHDIVVVGANATDSVMMWGNYSGFPSHTVTAMEGIKRFAPNAKFIGGCGLTRNETTADSLLQKIGNTETVIFIGGISPKLEGEEMKVSEEGFKGGDRTSIELPQAQRDMLNALKRAGKNVVFVNCSGSAMALVPEQKSCAAIIQAWYGGEQGGEALAEVLFGQYNPSGKLPVTFYRSTDDLPDFLDYSMTNRTYRYFQGEALFPFGYGLSYTTFDISKPQYIKNKVRVKVKNTGMVDGTEVVQVYIRNLADKKGPLKTLRAYQRVTLKAGETKTVDIDLPRSRFEGWDVQSNSMRVVPGRYELMAGSSSADKDLKKIQVTVK